MAFIIGAYNKYDAFDRTHSRYKFQINDNWYAVKEVELEWGQPVLPLQIDREEGYYCVYGTYEEALEFVRQMKRIN